MCNNTVFSHMSWIIVIKVVIYVSSGFRVGYLLFRLKCLVHPVCNAKSALSVR